MQNIQMGIRFKILLSAFLILGSLYFLFHGLVAGQDFLVPVVTALILAFLMNPVAQKLMKWGIGRFWAVLISDLIVVLFFAFMIFLLAAQANRVVKNWSQIEKSLKPKIEWVFQFYDENLRGSVGQFTQGRESQNQNQSSSQDANGKDQNQDGDQDKDENQKNESSQSQPDDKQIAGISLDNIRNSLTAIVSDIITFTSNLLLMLVYIFFFMYYQRKFENALVELFPEEKRENVRNVVKQSSGVAQQYLFGRLILIGILAGMYMLAFVILDLEYAIFIALLAALFALLPYIGNVIGFVLAVGISLMTGGDTAQLIGIVVSFTVIQLIENYFLEPYVIGQKVNLNPVIIIVGVVFGGFVWGIMGMLLVIPLLGILKVVFDNIATLNPLGYALGEKETSGDEDGMKKKIVKWKKGIMGKK